MVEDLQQHDVDSLDELALLHLQQVEQGAQHVLLDHGQQEMAMHFVGAYVLALDLQQVAGDLDDELHQLNVGFLSLLYRGLDIIGDVQDQVSNALVVHESFLVLS